jgi:proteasome accessory factor B
MLRIHEKLKGKRFPNCSRLAAELEYSAKTIQRDIDFMRYGLDLPIEFDAVRNGYFYSEPVENFPTVQVTEGELVSLFVAEKALAQYRGTPFEKPLHAAFEKLTAGLSERVSFPWSDLDSAISFRPVGTTVADLEQFEQISKAVLRSQEIEFEYRKLNSSSYEPRRVQPYHLACVENQWYLFAFDIGREQMRTFVLSRLRELRIASKRFVRPAGFSLSKHLGDAFGVFTGGKPQEIRIWFDEFGARLVRERTWHGSQKIKDLKNGEIELSLKLANFFEIERWVLGWGSHARVLAPEALRKQVAETVFRLAAFYSERLA